MNCWICPVCRESLVAYEKDAGCSQGHRYDFTKYGTLNLLLSQRQKEKPHGDSKAMVLARQNFLIKGHYGAFRDELARLITEAKPMTVFDAGCGEGWYAQALDVPELYGIDISKDAVRLAKKANPEMNLAVASTFALPLANESMDVVYSVFAPKSMPEIERVLKDKGIFIDVFPLPRHLIQIKEVLYPKAYLNPDYSPLTDGLVLESITEVFATIDLNTTQEIQDLLLMTPYYHRSPQAGIQALESLQFLQTEIGFGFAVYRKGVPNGL